MKKIAKYLSNRIEVTVDGCWKFTSFKCIKGYGICGSRAVYKLTGEHRAHRISYVLTRGSIPKGLYICHTCDVRDCVNPDHLFAGTQLDNMRDCVRKGRFCRQKGESNPFSKLTEKDVLEIRYLRKFGFTQQAISEAYDTSRSNVDAIVNRKHWSHV